MLARLLFAGSFLLTSLVAARGQGAPTADTAVIQGKAPSATDETPLNAPVEVKVDWSALQGKTTPQLFGLAGFKAGNPSIASKPEYQAGLAAMGIGSLRYHHAGSLGDFKEEDGWVDVANKRWAAEKIIAALKAWNPPGVVKIVNITGWPEWMDRDKDKFLDADQVDAFAAFCADLVKIVNIDGGLNVKYFEITNEKDGLYWSDLLREKKPLRIEDLADIYNRAAVAMKKVDPTIKTGGPAAMRPDQGEPLLQWAKAVLPNLDFLSVHMYASGDPKDPDIHIFDRTESMGESAATLRKFLDTASPDRRIELHVNEFNISWTWETRDVRMTNHIGAVFDALGLVQLATHGVDIINAWNEYDGTYGKMGGDLKLRAPGQNFRLFNQFLVGNWFAASSSQPRKVVPFAVKGANGFSVLLINRNSQDRETFLTFANKTPSTSSAKISRIDSTGFLEEQPFDAPDLLAGKPFTLPAKSVSVLHWTD